MALKILIIEDHEMFRDGLQMLVTELGKELNETTDIYLAANTQEASHLSAKHNDLALVLLDLKIPGSRALNTLKLVRKNLPLAAIIVISISDMNYTVRQIMEQGADGFIAKSSPKPLILDGIKKVLDGKLVTILGGSPEASDLYLSPRLIQTIELMEEGCTNKEIGKKLGISDITVREYVSDILRLLDVDNRVQAVVRARRLGLLID